MLTLCAVLAACSGTGSSPGSTGSSEVPVDPAEASTGSTSGPALRLARRRAEVVYVSDGDTIGVRLRGQERVRPVRLLGIDTPETKDPDTGVECGGPEASRALTDLLPRGTAVTLVTDPAEDRFDRFGRLLRYVDTAAHGDVALVLLRGGLARYYRYDHEGARFPSYRAAEDRARGAGRGSWSACPGFGRPGG